MRDIKAVFDIWNDVIKWVVFANDDWKDVILVKQVEQTKWMRKWKILDTEEFTKTINKITENFIKKLWWDFIDEVFVWLSHPETQIIRIKEQKRIMKWEVWTDDINHLSKVMSEIATKENFETIKIIPVHWIIDESKKEKDPLWVKWSKLELVADIFMIPKTFYSTLNEVFEKVWLHIADIVPNIVSASEIALDYDHKDLGSILIDIWKNQTSYVIYEDWFPLWYWIIPIWWEEVTKDISIWMQIDIKDAENIKKTHWSAMLENNTKFNEDTSLDIQFLSDIISARYEEKFIKINKHLEILNKDRKLPWWVILIWWASKVSNIDILAKDIFKLATFFWKDNQLWLWDISNNLQFINVLWTYARSNKYMDWRKSSFKFNFNIANKIKWIFKDLF